MSFDPVNKMAGDCPFSAMGNSMCPQDISAAALHHIEAYSAFLSVPVPDFVSVVIALLILAGFILFFITQSIFGPPVELAFTDVSHPKYQKDKKLIKWLSLFENSPSFH
jgi:hypothetical protein